MLIVATIVSVISILISLLSIFICFKMIIRFRDLENDFWSLRSDVRKEEH